MFGRQISHKLFLSKIFSFQIGISKNFYINTIYSKNSNYKLTDAVIKENSAQPTSLGTNNLGQPTPQTHPHLLNSGEVTPGITQEEYRDRRLNLLYKIKKYAIDTQSKAKNHVIIIPSATKRYLSDKIPYVFRQNTDFFYLTGCLEPDTILVLEIDEKDNTKSTLFMRPKDKNAELWDGPRTGVEYSTLFFGVEESYDIAKYNTVLENKISKNPAGLSVWYDNKNSPQAHLNDGIKSEANNKINNPTVFLHTLRVQKSQAEMNLMRKTCQIASQSINETIQETNVGDSEHHIFALVDFKCRSKNASYLAYPPVVACGNNATTIHYINNTQLTKNGDLVLLDAGCEYGGYTSDITRTWPVNGTFTVAQKVLYDVILMLQNDLLETLLKEGGYTLDSLFDTMCLKLGKYLQEVGLISKTLQGFALAKAAYTFCPHHVSHYLGMDVHDTPLISRSTKLIPGMVCTVEPGIYIGHERKDVPAEFRGIGIRIEDDVLIKSETEIEVLTSECVKNISDIEKLSKSRRRT